MFGITLPSIPIVLTGLVTSLTIYFDALLFLLRIIGIQYYVIRRDTDKVKHANNILKKETYSSSNIYQRGNLSYDGTFVGWYCFGRYLDTGEREDRNEIHIYTFPSYFNRLIETTNTTYSSFSLLHDKGKPVDIPSTPDCDSNDDSTTKLSTNSFRKSSAKRIINIWGRTGSYSNIWYSSIKLDLSSLYPKQEQDHIVTDIINLYNKQQRVCVFLHGVVGAGKSTIGLLVAKQLKGSFCHTFNPTEPGDTLHALLRETGTDEETPIVVVLEEVDTIINNAHNNLIERHKNIPIVVYNKSTLNTFLDDMILFKNVIIILTSNKTKESIDHLDSSYLRRGRVDACYSMLTPLTLDE
jgi:hypothetical protein